MTVPVSGNTDITRADVADTFRTQITDVVNALGKWHSGSNPSGNNAPISGAISSYSPVSLASVLLPSTTVTTSPVAADIATGNVSLSAVNTLLRNTAIVCSRARNVRLQKYYMGSLQYDQTNIAHLSASYQLGSVSATLVAPSAARIASVNTLVGGGGYVPLAYTGVILLGGNGSGVTANITISSTGGVASVNLVSGGVDYLPGDILTTPSGLIGGTGSGFSIEVDTVDINGTITALTSLTPGSLYTARPYLNVPLTGGAGTGAAANLAVGAGTGAVVSAVITNPGTGYVVGNVLSVSNVNLGGSGAGFSVTVASVDQATELDASNFNAFVTALQAEVTAHRNTTLTFVENWCHSSCHSSHSSRSRR